MDTRTEAGMADWQMIESTMTFHVNGEVEVPLKTEDGTVLGSLIFQDNHHGREGLTNWVAFHKVEMKEIISVDTANIVMWLKTRR